MDCVSCGNWPWATGGRLGNKRLLLRELRARLLEKSVPPLGSGHYPQESSLTGRCGGNLGSVHRGEVLEELQAMMKQQKGVEKMP